MNEYSQKFLRFVDLFLRFSNLKTEKTETGVRQFFEQQSFGVVPPNPDPCYLALVNGKQWFDWTVDEIHNSFGTEDWFGWDHFEKTVDEWLWPMYFGWAKDMIVWRKRNNLLLSRIERAVIGQK